MRVSNRPAPRRRVFDDRANRKPGPRKRQILNHADDFVSPIVSYAPARARSRTLRAIGSNDAIEHDARLVQRVSIAYQAPNTFHRPAMQKATEKRSPSRKSS